MQHVPPGVPWEVLVVDNASHDETAAQARALWQATAAAPLRVVSEPRIGLSFARERGGREARYGIICFVDDDNWLEPDYLARAWQIIATNPSVGACGGSVSPVFEAHEPAWFRGLSRNFAVGQQANTTGDVTNRPGHLWGAGLCVRKAAWERLEAAGFQSILSDRRGRELTSGGDYELCYALRLDGWNLYYDSDLRLRHFMPAVRMRWDYLLRLSRGHGVTRMGFDPYYFALRGWSPMLLRWGRPLWGWQTLIALGKVVGLHTIDWLRSIWTLDEGRVSRLSAEFQLGRLQFLLRARGDYDRTIDQVWRLAERLQNDRG